MRHRHDLPALIGSRICHDLISPIGAIGNGVELLGMTGMPQSPEMDLIAESVENANARIRFFRVAFGAAEDEQSLSRAEIAGVLRAAARGGRLSYFWEPDGDQPRREVRIAFLLLQCLETAMPFGGDIHIRKDDTTWNVRAEAEKLMVEPDLWEVLTNARARVPISAALVQFALLPDVLEQAGRTLTLQIGPDRILAGF
jgi:histidine phosphotransferase ChpT